MPNTLNNNNNNNHTTLSSLIKANQYQSAIEICPGCENHCSVKVFKFQNGNNYYSGNNCEKVYSNSSENLAKGVNMFAEKRKLLFRRKPVVQPSDDALTIGIPRALGMYENYPFWHTLFSSCGLKVVLSHYSTNSLYNSGIRTIMSDNICFPAKLMHGHILDLVHQKVHRIFYPYVIFERKEDELSRNSFNCPIVSGYSDVIKSSIDTASKYSIPFDAPVISFKDERLLRKACREYLISLQVKKSVIETAINNAIAAQNDYIQTLTDRAMQILLNAEATGRMVILLAARPYHIDPMIEHKISQAIADMGIDVVTENIAVKNSCNVYNELNAVSQWSYPNRIFKAAYFVGTSNNPNLHIVELTSFGCGPDAFILDEVNNLLRRYHKNLTILKIDDVNNIGSLRLRIRSLVESVKLQYAVSLTNKKALPHVTTKTFEEEDRRRTLLAPYFAEGYSEFVPSLFKLLGYNLVNLPTGNQEAAETGLKYANNDICYPATIVVGSIMNALKSGKYKPEDTAVIITQTGGQCRASNYLALLKNAIVSAKLPEIPVLSLATGDGLKNFQPGFVVNWKKIALITVHTILYADCLAKLYQSAVVREKEENAAQNLRHYFTQAAFPYIEANDYKALKKLLKNAVQKFSSIMDTEKKVPLIGLVGEIYVKYNAFSNKFVVDWLHKQGVEVVSPSLFNFFATRFANSHVNKKYHIKKEKLPLWLNDGFYKLLQYYVHQFDAICSSFPYYLPFSNIFNDAKEASKIVNLAGDFGEGWLIPAELCNLSAHGINNVISLQPFGCIANHVIAKGIEKRVKNIFPKMNLLFLDFDSSTSETNVFNRLHFMVENCKKQSNE